MSEIQQARNAASVDVLAIGAHPDDVEWGCGGLLAGLAEAGQRVAILILTRGEAGTRGNAEQRARESAAGAACLGVHCLDILDCGDGALRAGEEQEEQVMFFLRHLRPQVVLAPPLQDRHPDHERAGALVRSSFFYSGLVKRVARDPEGREVDGQALAPHRPERLLHYMLHDPFDPDVIVDCSSVWRKKIKALAAHRSQFPEARDSGAEGAHGSSAAPGVAVGDAESATWISKRSFWDAIEGRARHYGQRIGVEFAEPLSTGAPLGVNAGQFCNLFLDPS